MHANGYVQIRLCTRAPATFDAQIGTTSSLLCPALTCPTLPYPTLPCFTLTPIPIPTPTLILTPTPTPTLTLTLTLTLTPTLPCSTLLYTAIPCSMLPYPALLWTATCRGMRGGPRPSTPVAPAIKPAFSILPQDQTKETDGRTDKASKQRNRQTSKQAFAMHCT